MDRVSQLAQLQKLSEAARRASEGREQISRQEKVVEQLQQGGQTSQAGAALSLLNTLLQRQALHEQNLALISFEMENGPREQATNGNADSKA
jgi:hypothetical protein